jgi:hypothetical protein
MRRGENLHRKITVNCRFLTGLAIGNIYCQNSFFEAKALYIIMILLEPLSKLMRVYKKAKESGMMVIDQKPKPGDLRHENYNPNSRRGTSPSEHTI